jgi:hypothetical protein
VAAVSQGRFGFRDTGPLEWTEDDRWQLQSKCGRFAIRSQKVGDKTEHVLWRRGPDGRFIPKWLGVSKTVEEAKQLAEDAKFNPAPSWHGPR